jgi:cell wall-associated NlpC family hydrolase
LKYIFVVISVVFIFGCSSKEAKKVPEQKKEYTSLKYAKEIVLSTQTKEDAIETEKDIQELKTKEGFIEDLKNIPQNVDAFLENLQDKEKLYDIQKKYEYYYFSMWRKDSPKESLKEAMWPFNSYTYGKSYGENLQLLGEDFFEDMLYNANFKEYKKLNLKAITLYEIDIRAFPTSRPVLKDPSKAGEGFPFDYMQNSTVHANKPIMISHYSKDKEWAFVFTSFTSGWIKTRDLVVIDKKYTDIWQKAKQVRIVKEGVPIYDRYNNFMFKSKVGMMFALVAEGKNTYTILTVAKYKNNKPLFVKSKISKEIASKDVLKINKKNMKKIINEVSKTNYGWGGLYSQRDCSSMLRDLFAPFGIWLPRNSYQQAQVGKVFDLAGKSDDEKIEFIKKNAIAFETLLYKKGHIMLYLGTYDDEVVVFHNTWGVKTLKDSKEGRYVVAKPVYSTLDFGRGLQNYDEETSILKNLKSMNILTH